MRPGRTVTALAAMAAMVAALSSCSRPWMYDESNRIDEAMRCAKFDPDSAEARGIGLFQAAPQAPPWRSGEGYQLRSGAGRKQRLGRVEAAPPRAKAKAKKRSRR